MAKDYLCKKCNNNNHGWCKIKKTQVSTLKTLTHCENKDFDTTEESIPKPVIETTSNNANRVDNNMTFEDRGRLIEVGNAMGQREMLWYIQRACLANGGSLTLEDICKYDTACRIKEKIFKVENFEGELQGDARKDSIYITEHQNELLEKYNKGK